MIWPLQNSLWKVTVKSSSLRLKERLVIAEGFILLMECSQEAQQTLAWLAFRWVRKRVRVAFRDATRPCQRSCAPWRRCSYHPGCDGSKQNCLWQTYITNPFEIDQALWKKSFKVLIWISFPVLIKMRVIDQNYIHWRREGRQFWLLILEFQTCKPYEGWQQVR